MRTGNVVIGALAGLAIGATAGILFAPEKGSTTRKRIVEKGKSKVNKFSDSVKEKFESTKKDAENLAEKGKVKFDDAKKDVKNSSSNFNHYTSADYKNK